MKTPCRTKGNDLLVFFVVATLTATAMISAQRPSIYEGAPIHYETRVEGDVVDQLRLAIEGGKTILAHDREHGYLKSLLAALDIPLSSQVLVFSKTSFQNRLISPASPRAIYFGDDVYIGWVRGSSVIELSAVHPKQGAIFYTLTRTPEKPVFERKVGECLRCHGPSDVEGMPSHLIRSVHPDSRGMPIMRAGSHRTFHTSPLNERWGGWYVSGTSGEQLHMGNKLVREGEEFVDISSGHNIKDLDSLFHTAPYATRHSDIAALMVLEHQAQMHNLISYANFETRLAEHTQKAIGGTLGKTSSGVNLSTRRRIRAAASKVLDHLVFCDEAPLTATIQGTSGFQDEFSRLGPRDPKDRSLRELDLKTRLLRYPCSYLIYSPAFDALPQPVLNYIYNKLRKILIGKVHHSKYSHLSPTDRRAILEILIATKPNLPESWRQE
jgi:hypothetical protein